MNNDAISFSQPTGPRPPDRRAVLWDELARLHAQLGIEPPTATYGGEELSAVPSGDHMTWYGNHSADASASGSRR